MKFQKQRKININHLSSFNPSQLKQDFVLTVYHLNEYWNLRHNIAQLTFKLSQLTFLYDEPKAIEESRIKLDENKNWSVISR